MNHLRTLPLLLAAAALLAAPMSVPAKLQAAILQKVFAYDRALAGGNARVLVVHPDGAPGQRDELVRAFADNNVKASGVKAGDLRKEIGGATVVYLLPGVDPGPVGSLCAANKVLSVTGDNEVFREGGSAVQIGVEEGKPKIYVNLKRLRADGHELSSDLLKLAKVTE